MAWGDKAEWLESWKSETGEVLPALADKPALPSHLMLFWSAFASLSSDRAVGMSLGPIPFSSIDGYARRFGIGANGDVDGFERFHALIRAMDREFLSGQAKNETR